LVESGEPEFAFDLLFFLFLEADWELVLWSGEDDCDSDDMLLLWPDVPEVVLLAPLLGDVELGC
jgi:hypothetical protein